MFMSLTVPLATMKFDKPWSNVARASDAAPGVRGLAYTTMPVDACISWESVASRKGGYATLLEEHGLLQPPPDASGMQRVVLPATESRWAGVARPGFYRHIALEEYAAFIWSLEHCVISGETNVRCVQLADHQTQVGAQAKGRSGSMKLSRFCRQSWAVQIAADITAFTIWVPSTDNPADRPSSKFGLRADRIAGAKAARLNESIDWPTDPRSVYPPRARALRQLSDFLDHRTLAQGELCIFQALCREVERWGDAEGSRVYAFMRLFAGTGRADSLDKFVRRLRWRPGWLPIILAFDSRRDSRADVLDSAFFSGLRQLAYGGHLDALHGGPPCSTWSRVRLAPGGPPPVRFRARPFGLADLSKARRGECRKGSELFLRHLGLHQGVSRIGGSATLEHPADAGRAPFSNVFDTVPLKTF